MAEWSRFYPRLVPRAPGCPEPVMDQELRSAAADFLRRTRAWREWLPPVTMLAGVREYALPVPPGAVVMRLEQASRDGRPVPILSYRAPETDIDDAPVPEEGLTTRDRVVFTLAQLPAAGSLVAVQATLFPGEDSTGISDAMYAQYVDAITNGALARLLTMPNKPWTNFELAVVAGGQFEAAVGEVAADAFRGHTANTPRARVTWC